MGAKKSAPQIHKRLQQALDGFEKAVRALGKKDYERAREYFDAVITGYPEERDVVERARAYRLVCERSLGRKPSFRPKGFDDFLNYGVYLHNRGEYDEALKMFRQAAEIHPRNEHLLYCLAATAARAGDSETALKSLKSAIAANPASRTQARGDADFDSLREHEDFRELIDPTSA